MSSDDDLIIRGMQPSDLPEICKIQNACYRPDFIEDKAIFDEKLLLFPQGCFISILNNRCSGYIFSHPWKSSQIAPLNDSIHSIPQTCDCLYIHDCAIKPEVRKKGIGRFLIRKVFSFAKENGYATIQLVSVQKSQFYWNRFGFVPIKNFPPEILKNIRKYGEDAVLMRMTLSSL